jgi:hypothetical protein
MGSLQSPDITIDSYPGQHRYFTAEQYDDFFSSIWWGNPGPANPSERVHTN